MTSEQFYNELEKSFDQYDDYLQNKLMFQSIKDSNIRKFLKNNPTFYLTAIKDFVSGEKIPGMLITNNYVRQKSFSVKFYFKILKREHPILYRIRKIMYGLIGIQI